MCVCVSVVSWCEKMYMAKWTLTQDEEETEWKMSCLFIKFSFFVSLSLFYLFLSVSIQFWRCMLSTWCSISLNYLFRMKKWKKKKRHLYYDFDLVMVRVLTEINYHSNWWSHYNFFNAYGNEEIKKKEKKNRMEWFSVFRSTNETIERKFIQCEWAYIKAQKTSS